MPFTPQEMLFYAFGTALVGSATAVVLARNAVHSALFLVLAFVSSACLWVLLQAEFLGIALVLVYVGAVMVLFLFVVMMLDVEVAAVREGLVRNAPFAGLIALLVIVEIGYVVWARKLGVDLIPAPAAKPADWSNTQELGTLIYTEYLYAFEVAGVILLVGIIAAIALTLRRREGTRTQDVAVQVRVKRADRLRVVQVPPEERR
jgi:NADH-quinone oxidoreductase subunit J